MQEKGKVVTDKQNFSLPMLKNNKERTQVSSLAANFEEAKQENQGIKENSFSYQRQMKTSKIFRKKFFCFFFFIC